ncbi:MAG: hypothetical protein ACOCRX_04595 [Candidatus Woesearchaeota archaeon]
MITKRIINEHVETLIILFKIDKKGKALFIDIEESHTENNYDFETETCLLELGFENIPENIKAGIYRGFVDVFYSSEPQTRHYPGDEEWRFEMKDKFKKVL